ncbi:hypothetical protein GCM10009411_06020 [Shewanella litoralis]|uniref:Uncharacterized protein n=1 Tax=Shewanella litoralis TaxID=2282700 RepID=A0ABQ2R0Y5_9GAMM|nr:hypothetical protein GCM10009411_06020 [Shewanella litoralis]
MLKANIIDPLSVLFGFGWANFAVKKWLIRVRDKPKGLTEVVKSNGLNRVRFNGNECPGD